VILLVLHFFVIDMCICEYCLCAKMLTSQVNRCDHPAVQLQFFETVVRYEKFFGIELQFLPDVLVSTIALLSVVVIVQSSSIRGLTTS